MILHIRSQSRPYIIIEKLFGWPQNNIIDFLAPTSMVAVKGITDSSVVDMTTSGSLNEAVPAVESIE